jgi:hypothetical protein
MKKGNFLTTSFAWRALLQEGSSRLLLLGIVLVPLNYLVFTYDLGVNAVCGS